MEQNTPAFTAARSLPYVEGVGQTFGMVGYPISAALFKERNHGWIGPSIRHGGRGGGTLRTKSYVHTPKLHFLK